MDYATTKIQRMIAELTEEKRIAVKLGRYTKGELIKEVIEKLKIIDQA